MTAKKLRPFHESIIKQIKTADAIQLEGIASLLETTLVPKNHTEIIIAWMTQCVSLRFNRERTVKIAHILLEQGHQLAEQNATP
jgi:hypothetical protein